jgi:hypothetical protein
LTGNHPQSFTAHTASQRCNKNKNTRMYNNGQISIKKLSSIESIKHSWDNLVTDYFQTSEFSLHLEKYNKCFQRYYTLYDRNNLMAGAIVYTLPINLLTFSKKKLTLPMNVIGVAVSVDSSGLIGDSAYYDTLIDLIIKNEKGIILCLNYESKLNQHRLIQLNALPTFIVKHHFVDFNLYLNKMRHPYRRRVIQAMKYFEDVIKTTELCSSFTDEHYTLYLNIMKKSKTQLEVLSKDFFKNLPENFTLTSYYNKKKELIIWHITCEYKDVYSFLFGGINYEKRDEYHAYYNNLIGIIKEGIVKGYKTINLGQTAEVPKMRLGGERILKKMFIYHRNSLVRFILKVFKKQLEHKGNSETLKVFKNEYTICSSGTTGRDHRVAACNDC